MPSQKLIDELEIIIHRNKQFALRQKLFDADPTCGTCSARIEHIEDCAPVKLADGSEFLSHDRCFQMQIEQMAMRYWRSGSV